MTTLLAGIVTLGILVFIHELGHFLVAKACGVKVLKFSIGFGPSLLDKQYGETVYQISAIPLGGYVQMLGEGVDEEGEMLELTPEEEARSFAHKSVGQRLAIVCAGPLMNLLLPLIILPISFMVGAQMPVYLEQPTCAGYVLEDSSAWNAGFRNHDCIQSINGQPVESWNSTNKIFVTEAGNELVFDVDRSGESLQLSLPADNDSLEGLRALGLWPQQRAVVGGLAAGMPAAEAGIQQGDLILKIGDRSIDDFYQLRPLMQSIGNSSVAVTLQREGEIIIVEMTPKQQEVGGDYLLGIGPMQEMETVRFGPVKAFSEGADRTWELIELTVVFVQKLFGGKVSTDNIGGPITVVQIAGQAAQSDLAAIMSVLAFISIQLGILNLLPIPVLDGGHILFYLIELVMRRPLSLKVRGMAQQVGMALLLLLMVFALSNDIKRIFFN